MGSVDMRTGALCLLAAISFGCAVSPRVSATGRAQFRVVMLPPDTNDVPMFSDELEQLRRAAAVWLADHGYKLVPLEEVDALTAVARAGKRRPDGPVCAAPVGSHAMRAEHFAGALDARLSADCHSAACKLTLSLSVPPAGEGAWKQVADYEASAPGLPTLQAWLDAANNLAEPPPEKHPGSLVIGRIERDLPMPPVEVRRTRAWGQWARAPTIESLKAFEPKLARCHEAGHHSAGEDTATLAVGSDGIVTRCEATSGLDSDETTRLECLCQSWQQYRFEPGAADRRLIIRTMNALEPRVAHDGFSYGAAIEAPTSTSGPLWPTVSETTLAECYATAHGAGVARFQVRWELDEAGHPASASTAVPQAPLRTCLDRALMQARFPCTRSGKPEVVSATLRLSSWKEETSLQRRPEREQPAAPTPLQI